MILDTPDITPLGHVLRLISTPGSVVARFILRNRDTGELSFVDVVEIDDYEHERERGAIFFGGKLEDGRRIRGYVFATPQDEDEDVLGSVTVE